MTSLRIKDGLDLIQLKSNFPTLYSSDIEKQAKEWCTKKLAIINDSKLQLTIDGWLISDYLASELFIL